MAPAGGGDALVWCAGQDGAGRGGARGVEARPGEGSAPSVDVAPRHCAAHAYWLHKLALGTLVLASWCVTNQLPHVVVADAAVCGD